MFQVNKSSSDFWNNLMLTWQQCTDLPLKCWVNSVAELDGKVYAAMYNNMGGYRDPLMYDSSKDQWSVLPELPYAYFSLVSIPDRKHLLAIGGMKSNNGVAEITNKVFLWDEANMKWTTPYPNMSTARSHCSSISHGSTVIVVGGVTCWDQWTMTRAVEVLHIKFESIKSYWSVVEHLPFIVYSAVPLIVDDKLYITVGYDKHGGAGSCNVITASLPELLQSSNNNTSSSHQVWSKLPDMPYCSYINHYQNHLITFGGFYLLEQPNTGKVVCTSVPLIHIYNLDTNTWDCVGEIPYSYLLGYSFHIRENKILFIGGLTGSFNTNVDDDIITACTILTFSP